LAYTARFGNGRLDSVAHRRDGLARQHELPQINGYLLHPSEQDMISAAGIKDQQLTIIVSMMLIAGVYTPFLAQMKNVLASAGLGSRALHICSEFRGHVDDFTYLAGARSGRLGLFRGWRCGSHGAGHTAWSCNLC
jgi:hypothetical protein